jgi:hypothetical protein
MLCDFSSFKRTTEFLPSVYFKIREPLVLDICKNWNQRTMDLNYFKSLQESAGFMKEPAGS